MTDRLVVTRNDHGEWCIIDLLLDYRICSYNRSNHGGVHLHVPIQGPALPLPAPVTSLGHAAAAAACVADATSVFRTSSLRRCILSSR